MSRSSVARPSARDRDDTRSPHGGDDDADAIATHHAFADAIRKMKKRSGRRRRGGGRRGRLPPRDDDLAPAEETSVDRVGAGSEHHQTARDGDFEEAPIAARDAQTDEV